MLLDFYVFYLAIQDADYLVGIFRKLSVVGNHYHRLVVLAGHGFQHVHNLYCRFGIKVSCWLIRKYYCRSGYKGSGDAYTLLLTTGHLFRLMPHSALKSYFFQHIHRHFPALAQRYPLKNQREFNIFQCCHRTYQVVALEYKAQIFLPKFCQLIFAHLAY